MLTTVLATCLLATLSAAQPPSGGSARADRVQIYLHPVGPPSSGFVDVDSKRLVDSHADLLKKLQGQRTVILATNRDQADAELTLVSSKEEPTDREVSGGLFIRVTRKTLPTIRVRLVSGDYERELRGQATWGGAAEKVAEEVGAWAKDNLPLIVSRRR